MDTQILKVAEAVFPSQKLLHIAYARLFVGKSGEQLRQTRVEGIFALVENISSGGAVFHNINLIFGTSIVWTYCVPSHGELIFEPFAQDCVIFDGTDCGYMLQFAECCQRDEALQVLRALPIKMLDEFNVQAKKKSDGYMILDQPSAPIIIQQTSANVLVKDSEQQLTDVVSQAYNTFLTSAYNAPELYLALASIQGQVQQGMLLQEYAQAIVLKTLDTLDKSVSAVVNSRCLKLLQLFVEQDHLFVKELLEGNERWKINGRSFLQIISTVLTKRCINAAPKAGVLLSNNELISSVSSLLSQIFAADLSFSSKVSAVQESRRRSQNITKVYAKTQSVSPIVCLNVALVEFAELQQLLNILLGMVMYLSEQGKEEYVVTPTPAGTPQINHSLLQRKIQDATKNDVCSEVLEVIGAILILAEAAKIETEAQGARATFDLHFPKTGHAELSYLIVELTRQIDLEYACYLTAGQRKQLVPYFIESGYAQNMRCSLRVLSFVFEQASSQPELYQTAQQVLLHISNKIQPLTRYLYAMSSSSAFFLDQYEVSMYDNVDMDFFIESQEQLLVQFTHLLHHISEFGRCVARGIGEKSRAVNELNCVLFGAMANLAVKCLICISSSRYNTFSRQFYSLKPTNSVMGIYCGEAAAFQKLIVDSPDFQPTELFVTQLFSHIKAFLRHITAPADIDVHLTEEQHIKLLSYSAEIFAAMIGILTRIMATRKLNQQVYYNLGVLGILCECVRFSVTDMCKHYFNTNSLELVGQFRENLIELFKMVMVDRSKVGEATKQTTEDTVNLIRVLPLMLDFQFGQTAKPNQQHVLDEIKLYDSMIQTVVSKAVVGLDAMNDLVDACLFFNAQLLKAMLTYDKLDILQLNMLKTFVTAMGIFFDQNLNQQLLSAVHTKAREYIALGQMFQMACLMMRLGMALPGEAETQTLSQSALKVLMTFYNLPNNVKLLSQFLHEDIHQTQGRGLRDFVELTHKLLLANQDKQIVFQQALMEQLSLLTQNMVVVLMLDVFSKQSVSALEAQGIQVLTEQIGFNQAAKLFVSKEQEQRNVHTDILSTNTNVKLPRYSKYLDDGVRIELFHVLKLFLASGNPATKSSALITLAFLMQTYRNKVKLFLTRFEADAETGSLCDLVDGPTLESIFKQLQADDVTLPQRQCVIKVLCYLFELVPEHVMLMSATPAFLADFMRRQADATQFDEFSMQACAKMIYLYLKRQELVPKQTRLFDVQSLLQSMLRFGLDPQKQKTPNLPVVYYILCTLELAAVQYDPYDIACSVFSRESYIQNLVATTHLILGAEKQDDISLAREICVKAIHICDLQLYNATLLTTQPDALYKERVEKRPQIDAIKLKQQVTAACEVSVGAVDGILTLLQKTLHADWLIRSILPQQNWQLYYQVTEALTLLLKQDTIAQSVISHVLTSSKFIIQGAVQVIQSGFGLQIVQEVPGETQKQTPACIRQVTLTVTQQYEKRTDTQAQHALENLITMSMTLLYLVFTQQKDRAAAERVFVEVPQMSHMLVGTLKHCRGELLKPSSRQACVGLSTIARMAGTVLDVLLQISEITRGVYLQRHYASVLDELSQQLTALERPIQTGDQQTSIFSTGMRSGGSDGRADVCLLFLRIYIRNLFFLSQTEAFREKVAQNPSIIVQTGRTLFLPIYKVAVEDETKRLAARTIQNLAAPEAVPILVADNYNRGINGIPVLRVAINYLKYLLDGKLSVVPGVVEALLATIQQLITYKGSRVEQTKQVLMAFMPETYQIVREVAVMQGAQSFAEAAGQVADLIERL